VLHTLQLAGQSVQGGVVRDDAIVIAKPVLERCLENANKVKVVFDKALPTKKTPALERNKRLI